MVYDGFCRIDIGGSALFGRQMKASAISIIPRVTHVRIYVK